MEDCAPSCAKWFLFFINVGIFLIGAASLAVGIWCAVDQGSFIAIINTAGYATPADLQGMQNMPSMIEVAVIVLIGIGGFTLIVGLSGCIGAFKESQCLLWIYAFFVLVSFLFMMGAGILGAVFNGQVRTTVDQFLLSTLNYSFIGVYNTTNPQGAAWFAVMQSFQCCGFYGPSDFETNYNTYAYNWSTNYRTYCYPVGSFCVNGTAVAIPNSCCIYKNGQFWTPAAMLDYDCPQNPTPNNSYTQGCHVSVENWLNNNSIIILAVAFGLSGLLIIAFVGACCLIRAIDTAI